MRKVEPLTLDTEAEVTSKGDRMRVRQVEGDVGGSSKARGPHAETMSSRLAPPSPVPSRGFERALSQRGDKGGDSTVSHLGDMGR